MTTGHCLGCGGQTKRFVSSGKFARRCDPCIANGVKLKRLSVSQACKTCGKEYFPRYGKHAGFCSMGCRRLPARRIDPSIKAQRQKLRSKNRKGTRVIEGTCAQCLGFFSRKVRGGKPKTGSEGVYCGRVCALLAASARFSDPAFPRHKTVSNPDSQRRTITRWKRIYREWADRNYRSCPSCRDEFLWRNRVSGHCSKSCARRTLMDLSTRGIATRQCRECNILFSNLSGFRGSQYCTDSCRQAAVGRKLRLTRSKSKAMRRCRAKTNGPYHLIDPIDVFIRDGWRCRNCGCDTPQELRGTYECNAPELDHNVPLSKGGSHTMDNVQLLCRTCNGLKGDKTEWAPLKGTGGKCFLINDLEGIRAPGSLSKSQNSRPNRH